LALVLVSASRVCVERLLKLVLIALLLLARIVAGIYIVELQR